MEREIVADVLERMEVLEAESGDERQFHIEDAVFVVGSEDKIRVGVADCSKRVMDEGQLGAEGLVNQRETGFGVRHVRVIEAHFGDLHPGAQVEIRASGVADVIEFCIAVEGLQGADDIDCSDAREDDFCVREVQAELFACFGEQFALTFLRHNDIFLCRKGTINFVFSHSFQNLGAKVQKKSHIRKGTRDFFLLRRAGSNHRPSGYEPDELPLLYSAI